MSLSEECLQIIFFNTSSKNMASFPPFLLSFFFPFFPANIHFLDCFLSYDSTSALIYLFFCVPRSHPAPSIFPPPITPPPKKKLFSLLQSPPTCPNFPPKPSCLPKDEILAKGSANSNHKKRRFHVLYVHETKHSETLGV